jgi:putative copper resistance protein D
MSLETADWVRAIERGLHLGASFSVFGVILFRTVLARPVVPHLSDEAAERFDRSCAGLVWFSAEVAVFAAAAWLLMQAAYMSLSDTIGGTLEAVPAVLFGTAFGHLLLLRLVLLGAAVALFRMGWEGARGLAALLLAGASVALHAGTGHGAAMEGGFGTLLTAALALHLTAAAAWLGSLVPLVLLLRDAPREAADMARRRFAPFGLACVVTLAVTALFQGQTVIGGWEALWQTEYGLWAVAKTALFALLLMFAAANQFLLAETRLRASVALEAVTGLLVVLAASVLVNLPPPMHG